MTTDFKNERCLLLQDEEQRPLAVINCKSGLRVINNQLVQAISEHLDNTLVNITTITTITDETPVITFQAVIYEDEEYNETFTLSFIAVY